MTYRISGLDPRRFEHLHALDDVALESHLARRVPVTAKPGFPCRVTLDDAEPGETALLVHHVSHEADTPFRSAHAIYVRPGRKAAVFVDKVPPVMRTRVLSLRGFDAAGMLTAARLAQPAEAEAGILALFADPAVDHIDAHNAIPGCFAARVERCS